MQAIVNDSLGKKKHEKQTHMFINMRKISLNGEKTNVLGKTKMC